MGGGADDDLMYIVDNNSALPVMCKVRDTWKCVCVCWLYKHKKQKGYTFLVITGEGLETVPDACKLSHAHSESLPSKQNNNGISKRQHCRLEGKGTKFECVLTTGDWLQFLHQAGHRATFWFSDVRLDELIHCNVKYKMQKLYTDSKMRLLLENGEGKKKMEGKVITNTNTKRRKIFFFISRWHLTKRSRKKMISQWHLTRCWKLKLSFHVLSRAYKTLYNDRI